MDNLTMRASSPLHLSTASTSPLLCDIFCRVIDNFGDIGMCWRLAADLTTRGHQVRLWVDDPTALHWMAPGALQGNYQGLQVLPWEQSTQTEVVLALTPADVWVETFGCEIATEFVALSIKKITTVSANGNKLPVWINLEYLSAEGFAQRNHTLPSPVMHGPASGWTKYFFYPGFTAGTGGLVREPDLAERHANFDRTQWLRRHSIRWQGERLISLFCYEPTALPHFLQQLHDDAAPTLLLVTSGRATKAIQAIDHALPPGSSLTVRYLPALTQMEYDHLLWACDFNCVRGEDSLVRALWAQKPFVWQIYPQDDGAHHAKLNAFLDILKADLSLRQFHLAWNAAPAHTALTTASAAAPGLIDASDTPALPQLDLPAWQANLSPTLERLRHMDDLCTQLIQFVQKTR